MSTGTTLTKNQTVAGPGAVIMGGATGSGPSMHTAHAIFTPSGGGKGAIFNITAAAGPITVATVVDGGEGYAVNDVLGVIGGNGDATLTVATLSGTAAATVTITTAGTAYKTGSAATISSTTARANTGFSALTFSIQGSNDGQNWFDLAAAHVCTAAELVIGSAIFTSANTPVNQIRSFVHTVAPNGTAVDPSISIYYWPSRD